MRLHIKFAKIIDFSIFVLTFPVKPCHSRQRLQNTIFISIVPTVASLRLQAYTLVFNDLK